MEAILGSLGLTHPQCSRQENGKSFHELLLCSQHQVQGPTVLPNPFWTRDAAMEMPKGNLQCLRKPKGPRCALGVSLLRGTPGAGREVMQPPNPAVLCQLRAPDQGPLYLFLINYTLITPHEQPVPSIVSDSTGGRKSRLPQQTKVSPGVGGTGLSSPCPVTALVAPFCSLDCAL